MNNYSFKVSKLAKLVSSNLSKYFVKHEMEEFQNMILEMGLKHIDAFGFLSFYINPEDHSKINDEYFRNQKNLILQKNVSYSLFFFHLENYLKQFQKQDIEIINRKLRLVFKAYKIFIITILKFFDKFGLPEKSWKQFMKNLQQELTEIMFVYNGDINVKDINYIKKIIPKSFGTDKKDRKKIQTIKDIIMPEYLETFFEFEKSFIETKVIKKMEDGSLWWIKSPKISLIAFIIILYDYDYINKKVFNYRTQCRKVFEKRYNINLGQLFEKKRVEKNRKKIKEYKTFPVYKDITRPK